MRSAKDAAEAAPAPFFESSQVFLDDMAAGFLGSCYGASLNGGAICLIVFLTMSAPVSSMITRML